MSLKQYFSIYLLLALALPLFGAVHTRLVLISNSFNTPAAGQGTLVLDVEAISDDGQQFIRVFQNAFQLDAIFRGQNPQVSFSAQRFPADLVPPGLPNYNVTEAYRATDGRVSYTYTYNSGNFGTIEVTYTPVVRITIVYDMAPASGALNWFAGLPNYNVTNFSNTDITGNEEAIPALLTDISLPVQLSAFSAGIEDQKALLQWETGSEINNLGFEVYRATAAAGEYVKIASYEDDETLAGAGNSSSARQYRYADGNVSGGATYWYQLADVDYQGVRSFHGPVSVEAPEALPEVFALHQNYPNPFNPETRIRFDIPAQAGGRMELTIYNSLGMKVRTLADGRLAPGRHLLVWDGRNDRGDQLASGIYFLRFQAADFTQTRKMLLVR